MGVPDHIRRVTDDQSEKMREFFEPQLKELGLGADQIDKQSLDELSMSLQRVNDALQHPESFGILRIAYSAKAGVMLVTGASEAHVEVGILPILLERKKMILERIQLLKGEQKIESIRDLVDRVDDSEVRDRIQKEIDELEKLPQAMREELDEIKKKQQVV